MAGQEHAHDDVYGRTFELYSTEQTIEFMEPFTVRLRGNGLVPRTLFEGRECLDAGCGGGRGSILMAQAGAASVTGIDVSSRNVESTNRQAAALGFDQVDARQGSLAAVPFDDDSFDFVWCNGVLQHTADPTACFTELVRVLRPGGRMWLYVYGAGGLYWYLVARIRAVLGDLPTTALIAQLRLQGLPPRYVAEYVDDWKAGHLRAWTRDEVEATAASLGLIAQWLPRGMPYDTSERIVARPEERAWLGEGDLRLLLTKDAPGQECVRLPDQEAEIEQHAYADEVVGLLREPIDELLGSSEGNVPLWIAAFARIQRDLRDRLTAQEPLDVQGFVSTVRQTSSLLEAAITP